MARYCPNCGNPLEENASFCTKCGSAVQNQENNTYNNNNNGYNNYNNGYNNYNNGYNNYYNQNVNQPPIQNTSTPKTALVLGILGIVFAFIFALVGHILTIIGIVIGNKEKNTMNYSTGLTLSIIGEVCSALSSLLGILYSLFIIDLLL